ncbi:hypothetical protein SKAU_G00164930 [Synaphobranchus kaupii]|uniref:Uncharacterized protein n=1 Tax=Synaphobranchus kaupii TaxID=118154 RepID=A0A9Q1FJE6_SYNKA|nr:hypothetical protein SKAU_G00164930 [Synaphobranchus kaupii]
MPLRLIALTHAELLLTHQLALSETPTRGDAAHSKCGGFHWHNERKRLIPCLRLSTKSQRYEIDLWQNDCRGHDTLKPLYVAGWCRGPEYNRGPEKVTAAPRARAMEKHERSVSGRPTVTARISLFTRASAAPQDRPSTSGSGRERQTSPFPRPLPRPPVSPPFPRWRLGRPAAFPRGRGAGGDCASTSSGRRPGSTRPVRCGFSGFSFSPQAYPQRKPGSKSQKDASPPRLHAHTDARSNALAREDHNTPLRRCLARLHAHHTSLIRPRCRRPSLRRPWVEAQRLQVVERRPPRVVPCARAAGLIAGVNCDERVRAQGFAGGPRWRTAAF